MTMATKLKQLTGKAGPLVLALQVLIVPYKAFRRIRERGYTWLSILVYAFSAMLAGFTIYARTESYSRWTLFFHPIQTILQSFFSSLPSSGFIDSSGLVNSLSIPWVVAIVFVDIVALAVCGTCASVAGRALLGLEIRARNICSSLYLVVGVASLLVWPLFLLDSFSRIFDVQNFDLESVIVVLLWIAFTIYYLIALVAIGDISILKAIGLYSLTLLFFPIWIVGSLVRSIPFLTPKFKQDGRSPAISGILLYPGETIKNIKSSGTFWSPLAIYLGLSFLLVALVAISLNRRSDDFFPLVFLAMIPFFKAHIILFSFALNFLFVMVPSNFGTLQSILNEHILLYPYLVIGPVGFLVLFVASAHLTITRIMDTGKQPFRHLLASFFYISNSATLYLIIPNAVLFALIIFRETFDQSSVIEGVALFYFGWFYLVIFFWSVLMHIIAIGYVYELPSGRALGAWFASIVLFIPVSLVVLVARAFEEIIRPFRVQSRVRELDKLRYEVIEHVHRNELEIAKQKTEQIIELYSLTHEISRRARSQVDLLQPLRMLYSISQEPVLDFILKLGRHTDNDVQIRASQILRDLLDESPELVISSIYYLMNNQSPPGLFGRMNDEPRQTQSTRLGRRIYALLTEANDENLVEQLQETRDVLETWRDRQRGEEVYQVYRALHTLSQARNVIDLELSSGELVAALDPGAPLLSESAQTLKQLLDISNYLAYYQRAEFENKIPYLAAPIMILVDELRRLDKSKFPPEDRILRILIGRLQDIIFREFDGLRGRADLRFELKPQRAPFDREVSLVLYLRNQGSAAAETLSVSLESSINSNFTVSGNPSIKVSLLSPKREARLEFNIIPTEAGRLRIPFNITYDDLEKKGRSMPYAALVELYEPSDETLPDLPSENFKNPYITGLPVKDPAMFFGREDVFRFIRDHLQGQHEKNVLVLSAPRRTGKTSILYQLGNHLDEKYIPVLLDLQGFASTGTDRFLYWMARLITRAVNEHGDAFVLPGLERFREDPFGAFQQIFLPDVLKHIGYHHLLLAFDEFEELAARVEDGKVDKDIFPFLRNMMQHTTQVDFIFAGTHKLRQITFEYWSILFNIALFRDIGFMKPEEVAQAIRMPVKGVIFYDDLAIEKINRITAGHPYFVQLLGNKLVDYYQQEGKFYITLQDVNRVLEDVIVGGALHFDYLWGDSTVEERLMMAAMTRIISREGGVASLADILVLLERFEVKLSQQQLLAAARMLVTRDMVLTDSDFSHFEFKIDLIRLWLDRYQRFGIVAEAYRDQQRPSSQPTHIEIGGN